MTNEKIDRKYLICTIDDNGICEPCLIVDSEGMAKEEAEELCADREKEHFVFQMIGSAKPVTEVKWQGVSGA